jgi:hypothetical protein
MREELVREATLESAMNPFIRAYQLQSLAECGGGMG